MYKVEVIDVPVSKIWEVRSEKDVRVGIKSS